MRRRYKYAFTKKGETEGGFASAIFAGISLFLFLVSAVLSFVWEGKAGSWIERFRFYGDLVCRMWFFYRYEELSGKRKKLSSQCAGGYGKWSFVRGLAGPFSDRSVEEWKNV